MIEVDEDVDFFIGHIKFITIVREQVELWFEEFLNFGISEDLINF